MYVTQVAASRTFTVYEDIEELIKLGKIKGGSLDCAVVIKGDKIISKEPLRFADEFVRRVDFPDGTKLELGGIAYSESAPFAYLNGRLLKVGEAIAGYTLVAVERDRVVVRGAAGELTILVKPRS